LSSGRDARRRDCTLAIPPVLRYAANRFPRMSFIRLLVSPDGGSSWQGPFTIAPATATRPQHVHPSISVDPEGQQVTVGYYAQLSSGQIQFDATTAEVGSSGGLSGSRPAAGRPRHGVVATIR
jgi:hypothetical protein